MADKTISEINTSNNLPSPTGNEVVVAYDPDNPSASVGIVLSALPVSSPTQTALNGKANTSHTHAIADVTDLQSTLDGKVDAAAIGAAIDDLIDGAPTELNTLNELAAAIGDDPNYSTTVTNALAGKANTTHTHTATDVTDFDAEVSNNTDVAGNTAARHTHANKALLDTYTQTEANLDDAVAKKHEHLNQAVLDATTASFLTADETKLDGIEALADVTDATNVDAAGAVMNSDSSTASMDFVIDEDNMASDSATKVPTQQSVKAYVDANAGGIADPGSNGILARTALNTTTARTLTGTTNQVSITNGDGVSGNPTFSLPQDIHTGASPVFANLGTSGSYLGNIYGTRHYLNSTAYLDGATAGQVVISGASSASSGVQSILSATSTITQSGPAGYTAFLVSVTESSTGSGTRRLIAARLGGTSVFDVDTAGNVRTQGVFNIVSFNNSRLQLLTTGATIDRNVADANHTLIVNNVNASNTGKILDLRFGGVSKASFDKDGKLTVPDEAYGAGWNGSLEVPTKNAVYDKVNSMFTGTANVTVNTVAPGSPAVGDIWVDIT